MRLVQVSSPPRTRDLVVETLEDEGIDYVVTDETSSREYAAVISFVLPVEAVEPVLDALRRAGLDDDATTVVIDVETVISEKYRELEERYEEDEDGDGRVSRQELRTRAVELTPTVPVYLTMTLISAVVATAGLLLDSPAIVVGSMVIAPLIGPALSASVGTVVNEPELFARGLKFQVVGVGVAVAGAALFAWLAKTAFLVPPGVAIADIGEISERLTPDLLSLFVALGAGVAGILSLATGISVALVGVMIAAALIPPAAAAGIAIAWGLPAAAIGSSVLVLVNLVSVNLAGLVTLWYMGYRPESWFQKSDVRRQVVKQVAIYAFAVVFLSTFLAGATVTSYQHATFENAVTEETEEVLDREAYEALELLSIEVRLDGSVPFESPERVIITIGHPNGEWYPVLTDELHAAIDDRIDEEVAVQVRFIAYEARS